MLICEMPSYICQLNELPVFYSIVGAHVPFSETENDEEK